MPFCNYKTEQEIDSKKMVESCEVWLQEAKSMAEMALVERASANGILFLYHYKQPVTSFERKEAVYFYPEQNPRYDTITHYGFIRHAFVLSFYYLLLADHQ